MFIVDYSKEIDRGLKPTVHNDFNLLKETEDSLRYVKSYSWNKITGELRPIIYSVNYETTDIKVVKRY